MQSSENCRRDLPERGGSPASSRSVPREQLGPLAQVRGRPELQRSFTWTTHPPNCSTKIAQGASLFSLSLKV